MGTTIQIHESVWQLSDIQEDIDWARQQNWRACTYINQEDHSHCRICWWAIGVSDNPEIGTGFNAGKDLWLCKECYSKFIADAP